MVIFERTQFLLERRYLIIEDLELFLQGLEKCSADRNTRTEPH